MWRNTLYTRRVPFFSIQNSDRLDQRFFRDDARLPDNALVSLGEIARQSFRQTARSNSVTVAVAGCVYRTPHFNIQLCTHHAPFSHVRHVRSSSREGLRFF